MKDEVLNRWQFVWRSIDEARLMPRLMVTTAFFSLVAYVYYGTWHFIAVVNGALVASTAGSATFGELTPVLAALTAFYSVTIPVLSKLFLDMWKDYRQSGTDWTHVEVKAEVGAANAPSGPSEGRS